MENQNSMQDIYNVYEEEYENLFNPTKGSVLLGESYYSNSLYYYFTFYS